jgi:hypothetical protein
MTCDHARVHAHIPQSKFRAPHVPHWKPFCAVKFRFMLYTAHWLNPPTEDLDSGDYDGYSVSIRDEEVGTWISPIEP